MNSLTSLKAQAGITDLKAMGQEQGKEPSKSEEQQDLPPPNYPLWIGFIMGLATAVLTGVLTSKQDRAIASPEAAVVAAEEGP